MEHSQFLPLVESIWTQSIHYADAAKRINAKMKVLRKHLKSWAKTLSNIKTDIADINALVAMMDTIENSRNLSDIESSFRDRLKNHLTHLLKQQKLYWQQRSKIKWVTLGSDNSKFFQSLATVQKRSNNIASLQTSDGSIVSTHEEKASLIHTAFKDRLGQTEPCSIPPDLLNLIVPHHDLSCLEVSFTHEEIDNIIKALPSNKSPGPDGFNIDFIKKCWHIIKMDFYDLCNQFFDGTLCLQSINNSFITLIPKKASALSVNDYRPISLLSCTIKLLTKLLANRLQAQGLQADIDSLKAELGLPFALEIIILASWAIWTTRNDWIFKRIVPSLYSCRKRFKEELKWLVHRAKRKAYHNMEGWVQAFA
ncbi:uncharacterized protein [Aegilops tauschii subsp. strangulata]|uniref:uncharacterized protein n=1 Tax=Aegilops tauschii subsp. strangulata TaxID=200361 RepID=UPI003CC89968